MSNPLAFQHWRDAGLSFNYRGHRIFFREHGNADDAPTLVCIHGFPTASWDWQALWPQLCARFPHVLAPDLIGFGWSAKPPHRRYSIFDQADLVETLLHERGVQHCHILAHDYGDTVTQELLARHVETREQGTLPAPVHVAGLEASAAPGGTAPFGIDSVCLLNGGLFPETHHARFVQKLLLTPLGPLLSELMNERSFSRSLAAVFGRNTQPGAAELHEFWQLMVHNDGQRLSDRLIRYIPERRANRSRWVGALQGTRVPLRLINGPDDPVSGAHMAERYRRLVPNPDVVLLPGIGHYPQVEDPAGTLAAFLQFHSSTAARGSPTGPETAA